MHFIVEWIINVVAHRHGWRYNKSCFELNERNKMAKKTFNVNDFKTSINWKLANCILSDGALTELCLTLEDILHATGNYAGFRYLNDFEVPKDCRPGIRNTESSDNSKWFVDTCEYRRKYC